MNSFWSWMKEWAGIGLGMALAMILFTLALVGMAACLPASAAMAAAA